MLKTQAGHSNSAFGDYVFEGRRSITQQWSRDRKGYGAFATVALILLVLILIWLFAFRKKLEDKDDEEDGNEFG